MGFPPEAFLFVGVDCFVAISLLASLFERSFPTATSYIYQTAALAGFGQIWANYAFLFSFVEARFWVSMLYLAVALINVVAVNLYIAINKKLLSSAGMFLGAFTIPTSFLSFLLLSAYVNGMAIPMPWLPIVPLESLYMVLVACTVIMGLSIVVYVEPSTLGKALRISRKRPASKRLDIAIGAMMTKEKEEEVKNE
jgi:hypothetical protein